MFSGLFIDQHGNEVELKDLNESNYRQLVTKKLAQGWVAHELTAVPAALHPWVETVALPPAVAE